MITPHTVLRDIHDHDDAYRFLCSIAAQDENQGGWENERIATLVTDPELAPKVARHGSDERMHGRIFQQLLRQRGMEPEEVPAAVDYCMLLEGWGIGLSHARLRLDEPLSDQEIIAYLVHSRVTEQRASEEIRMMCEAFSDRPEMGRAVRRISRDEDNHLAYTHEELLRFCAKGYAGLIRAMLRQAALAEIRAHRDVGLAVMERVGAILRWPSWQQRIIALGIHAQYSYERAYGWRRLVSLRMPEHRNALGGEPAETTVQ
jgi:rubrerythrin